MGSSGFNCLHTACDSDNGEIIAYLLQKRRVDPNVPGKNSWTPLEISIQSGLAENVRILLQDNRIKVVNQTVRSPRGTALHLAAKQGNFKIMNMLLINLPASIDLRHLRDSRGKTPRDVATNPKVLSLLEQFIAN